MRYGKNMSRLAKKPILIPPGVSITKTGDVYIFKGQKGELKKSFPSLIKIELRGEAAQLSLKNEGLKNSKAMLGTFAALFKNYLRGVSKGFEKKL